MSLNGLEATEVNDAYQFALGEGGGWLLLKYESRDEVGLLDKGNGGLTQVEEVVNQYEEKSPLYGFIQYRRRKVILKYIPEGTSRLLQARVTVQFQSVIEKFSPHDTIFSFDKSADLRDSIFSAACSLHTATASIKSSHESLPRKSLAEITEDASESKADSVEGRLAGGGDIEDELSSVIAEESRMRPEKVNESASAARARHRSTSVSTQNSGRSRTTSNTDKPLPPPPAEGRVRGNTIASSIPDHSDYDTRPSMDGRFSSSSIRPSTKDLYDAYGYMKKERLGPRPSTDSVGTPTSLGTRTTDFRPVSTLPAGLRMPLRKAVPIRPASQQAQPSLPIQTNSPTRPNPPALANSSEKMTPRKPATVPVAPIYTFDRNGSKSINALKTPRMSEPTSPKMTPEKQRLMKALQLRQKQLAAQNSVNGLGLKDMSEGLEPTHTHIDESILNAVIDASAPTEGDEPASIATIEIAKERARLPEDSPISIPETAEEPSTKASSITDDEATEAQKQLESYPISIFSISEPQDLSDNFATDSHLFPSGGQEVASATFERDLPVEAAVTGVPRDLPKSSASVQSEIHRSEHKVPGRESSEPTKHEEGLVTAGEVLGDRQLSRSQLMEGEVPREQHIAGNGAPLLGQGSTPTGFNGNEKFQHSGKSNDHIMATSAEECEKECHPQSRSPRENQKSYYPVDTNDQTRVIRTQSREGSRGSPDHTVYTSNEPTPEGVLNDNIQPLIVRRSIAKSIKVPSDDFGAHKIPLPPIDVDEEISLGFQQNVSRKQPAQNPVQTNEDSGRAPLQADLPLSQSDHSVTEPSNLTRVVERPAGRQIGRQGIGNPTKRESSPDQSDEQFLSDDSFMEELKSATLQEAKPISVSKSPIKPVFSGSENEQMLNGGAKSSRSVSSPVDQSIKGEEVLSSPRPPTPRSTPRSFSAQQAPRPDMQEPHVPITKKGGVSSSISQRIKALEQLSSRPTSPVSPNLPPNTSTFLGLRTASLRSAPGTSEYKTSNFSNSRPKTAYPSPSPSPELIKSSLVNQPDKTNRTRPIKSATAAVSRNAREKSPKARDREVQESPLQLELQKYPPSAEQNSMGPPLSPLKPPRPRFGRHASTHSGSSSSNEQKLEPPPTTRRDSFASIRSKSSRAGSEAELPRTLSDSSLSGATSLDGTQDEKKDSRRSRLLKRMSSISSMSRRSIANALSPGPKEAPIIERQEPTQEAPPSIVDVGDVNVQFPDNLLWKRRHMIIDESGVLVLSASKLDVNSKVITKRYPLSEFHPPYIPDQDRQELPNSVVLDFKDGSTLQCACEHLQGQAGLLKALKQAHSTQQSHP